MAHIPDIAGSQMCENCCATLDTLPCGALGLEQKAEVKLFPNFFPQISALPKRLGAEKVPKTFQKSQHFCLWEVFYRWLLGLWLSLGIKRERCGEIPSFEWMNLKGSRTSLGNSKQIFFRKLIRDTR